MEKNKKIAIIIFIGHILNDYVINFYTTETHLRDRLTSPIIVVSGTPNQNEIPYSVSNKDA